MIREIPVSLTASHMVPDGTIVASWQEGLEFANRRINGNQLGARITIVTSNR